MAVIAGVGVQQYYEKRGYVLEGTYMTKKLS
jgi:histone acetyltransferase (RNA polymerase elongator complex component)